MPIATWFSLQVLQSGCGEGCKDAACDSGSVLLSSAADAGRRGCSDNAFRKFSWPVSHTAALTHTLVQVVGRLASAARRAAKRQLGRARERTGRGRAARAGACIAEVVGIRAGLGHVMGSIFCHLACAVRLLRYQIMYWLRQHKIKSSALRVRVQRKLQVGFVAHVT